MACRCADGRAELLALLRVGERPLEGALGDPQGLGGYADAAAVQGLHGDLEPLSLLPQQVRARNAHVVKGEGSRGTASDPHLVLVSENGHAGRSQIDDESGDALVLEAPVAGGKQDACPQAGAVGDEDLGAVDDELIAFPPVGRRHARRIAPCVRLGEQDAADLAAGRQVGEVGRLLLLTAERDDRIAGEGAVRGNENPAGPTCLGDLFHYEDVREDVQPCALVLLGDEAPQEAHCAHLGDQLVGDGVLPVDIDGNRLDLVLSEVTHRIAKHFVVLTQFKIHTDILISLRSSPAQRIQPRAWLPGMDPASV